MLAATHTSQLTRPSWPRAANDNLTLAPYSPPAIEGGLVDRVFHLQFWSRGRARFRALLIAGGLLP